MDYLVHHGVIGMKWGVRRYQNEDGTLTELGQKRLNREKIENARKKKENRVNDEILLNDPERWVREDLINAQNVAYGTGKLIQAGQEIERKTRKTPKTDKQDLSSFSDNDLRNAINRMNLEKQYRELTAKPATVSKGRKIVQDILEYGGAALGATGTALGIALSIRKLKGD